MTQVKKLSPNQLYSDKWLLELEDIEKDTSCLIQKIKTKQRMPKSNKSAFVKGDILYGKLRPYLNKIIVAGRKRLCDTGNSFY